MADLFGEERAVAKRKPKKAPEAPPHIVTRAMAEYNDQHLKRFGVKPLLGGSAGARAGKIFKDLATSMSDDDLLMVIRAFIWSNDWKIRGGGYTVPELQREAPRLRLQLAGNGGPGNQRQAENLDAAQRATRRRPV